ncbi:Snd3p [Ascoidea rubescens DSM 1968]|uniref:Inorganic phosphate transport protein PHO88 n=1 Tax=Ascoidea rubescens DSM 1968 TaxID=1344418 RepID=A0A1D2VN44_9ASCO|nr:inorganic phosphate transport protein PHO88 [Ascoidea rubescens DSM 1968]ODV63004.1 inorganic phosphate transport protein PHO88 [Ascoidea rubescens DSM 1968]
MNPAVSNIVVMLVMMQVSKKFDWENPNTIFYVRILYVSCISFCLALYLFVRQKIVKKNELTTFKYFSDPNPMSGETEGKLVITTIKDYDLQQVNAQIKGIFTGVAMMGFMHLYMKYTNPLLMQSINPVKSAFESKVVKVHLFNQEAKGDLARPFKAAPLFGGASTPAKTDKQSIEKAEVSGSGGIKEE